MKIRDAINEILDELPDEELQKLYWSIRIFHEHYAFNRTLQDKGVVISPLYEDREHIKACWDKAFAHHVPDEIKEAIHYDQYKWHLFSYEQADCLQAEEARAAFDQMVKGDLYVMYQHGPDVFLYEHAKDLVSTDFDAQQDIYVFDREFSWTYVHTHEAMCGPYFATSK
ncbi:MULTISPECIES: DUF4275 family protein [Paenibacillus]|uniref:DUF4275 family protein n=1 Tax=Paenibacillus campinasensis TaxID=66347 RepID=A0ABW9SW80_9BACL|nr:MULTISPECIES: DUF4275 family protein [Paenibacillus]MUG65099.1 DUF4275 family protein [Paenibacillus campinasensis]PAK52333.1 hypothetical protein CHH75_12540 [Paenibacillus sp. 7541]